MKSLGKDIEIHWFDAGHGSLSVEQNIEFQEIMLRFGLPDFELPFFRNEPVTNVRGLYYQNIRSVSVQLHSILSPDRVSRLLPFVKETRCLLKAVYPNWSHRYLADQTGQVVS